MGRKERSLLERMQDKAREMEKKMVVKEKTPSRKRKKTRHEEEEEQKRMVEQKRMRKVMDRWRRKETPGIEIVEPDKLTVRNVVEENFVVVKNGVEEEKSTVQKARDRFMKLSKNQEDSFKVWKEKRVRNQENDRSAPDSITNDMSISSVGDGEGGAVERGEKLIVVGAAGLR